MKAKTLMNWRSVHSSIYLKISFLLLIACLITGVTFPDREAFLLDYRDRILAIETNVFNLNKSLTTEKLHCGVHQSFVLGPLLFSICFNDLPNIPQDSECIFYADDIYNFGTLNETTEHKTDFQLMSESMKNNNLSTKKAKK